MAYYSSQRKGASIHSPRTCIPGGGWEIADFSRRTIKSMALDDNTALAVNRAVIVKGAQKQLIYYWFEQRGRHLTNEYLVKWFLLWDALFLQRTDGALVRFVTPIPEGSEAMEADKRLTDFMALLYPRLPDFIPD